MRRETGRVAISTAMVGWFNCPRKRENTPKTIGKPASSSMIGGTITKHEHFCKMWLVLDWVAYLDFWCLWDWRVYHIPLKNISLRTWSISRWVDDSSCVRIRFLEVSGLVAWNATWWWFQMPLFLDHARVVVWFLLLKVITFILIPDFTKASRWVKPAVASLLLMVDPFGCFSK